MATVAVTINVDTAVLAQVENALCLAAGLPVSAANAKQALLNHIQQTVTNVAMSQAQVAPVVPPPLVGLS